MKPLNFSLQLLVASLMLVAYCNPAIAQDHGSITGNVYCDKDKNGICDCEEGGLKDIHILIHKKSCGGAVLQTIHTDVQGNFTFRGFEPGKYFIKVDLDYVCGGRVPTTATCQEVDLAAGETIALTAFGYTAYGE